MALKLRNKDPCTHCKDRQTANNYFQWKMKTFLALLVVLMLYNLCRAQTHSSNNNILLQDLSDEIGADLAETQRLSTQAGGEDIWAELRNLRDMVVEQNVELTHLTERVTALYSLVDGLQKENTAMEVRMTAAETLAEELQMENDAQAKELAIAQQKLSAIQETLIVSELRVEELEKQQEVQEREIVVAQQKLSAIQETLTVSELRVEELEKQQEGQNATVQELQNINRVSKLAFSASLLASGEGNTESGSDFTTLIFRNVFTNIGNHYNPHTGYFTAPVRGVYYFRYTGHIAHSENSMTMRLVKNGDAIIFIGDRPTSSIDLEDNASNGAVLQLEVGDVVSVQLGSSVWDDQYHRTTFSGFLLFPL